MQTIKFFGFRSKFQRTCIYICVWVCVCVHIYVYCVCTMCLCIVCVQLCVRVYCVNFKEENFGRNHDDVRDCIYTSVCASFIV